MAAALRLTRLEIDSGDARAAIADTGRLLDELGGAADRTSRRVGGITPALRDVADAAATALDGTVRQTTAMVEALGRARDATASATADMAAGQRGLLEETRAYHRDWTAGVKAYYDDVRTEGRRWVEDTAAYHRAVLENARATTAALRAEGERRADDDRRAVQASITAAATARAAQTPTPEQWLNNVMPAGAIGARNPFSSSVDEALAELEFSTVKARDAAAGFGAAINDNLKPAAEAFTALGQAVEPLGAVVPRVLGTVADAAESAGATILDFGARAGEAIAGLFDGAGTVAEQARTATDGARAYADEATAVARANDAVARSSADAGDGFGALDIAAQSAGAAVGHYAAAAGTLGRTLAAFGTLGLTAAAGIGVVVEAFDRAVGAEKEVNALNQSIRATGTAAAVTAPQMQRWAETVAQSTMATRDEVLDVEKDLLRFRGIVGDTFGAAVALSADMAAAFGGGVAQQAKVLGAALDDPRQAVERLTAAGVTFTDQQRATIDALAESGRMFDAQRAILDAVGGAVGGAGAGERAGLVGRVKDLGDAWDGLVRTLLTGDNALSQAAGNLLRYVSDGVNALNRALDTSAEAQLDRVLSQRAKLLERVQDPGTMARLSTDDLAGTVESLQRSYATEQDLRARILQRDLQREVDAEHKAADERAATVKALTGKVTAAYDEQAAVVLSHTQDAAAKIRAKEKETVDYLSGLRAELRANGGDTAGVDAAIAKAHEAARAALADLPAASTALADYLGKLQQERDQLFLTDREREIATKLLQAEAAARQDDITLTDRQRQAIQDEAGATYDLKKARELFDATVRDGQSDQDKYKAHVQEATAALKLLQDAGYKPAIESAEAFRKALAGQDPAFQQAQRAAEEYGRAVKQQAGQIARDWATAIFDGMTGKGKDQDILDWFRTLFRRIAIAAIEANIVLPVTTQIVSAVPGLFGIQAPAGLAGSGSAQALAINGQTNAPQGGGMGGSGSLLGSGSSLLNGGLYSQGLANAGTWLATSSLGQALGMSSTMTAADLAGAGVMGVQGGMQVGATSMTSLGSAFSAGLGYSPWGIIGGIGAQLLGIGKGADPWVSAGLSTVGSIGGATLGAAAGAGGTILGFEAGSILGPIGAIVGAVLGTALAGLFPADKQYPSAWYLGGWGKTGKGDALDGGDASAVQQAGDKATTALTKIAGALGLSAEQLPGGGFFDNSQGHPNVWMPDYIGAYVKDAQGKESFYKTGDMEGAVVEWMRQSLLHADTGAAGAATLDPIVKKALTNSASTTADQFASDVDFARSVADGTSALDGMIKDLDGLTASAKKTTADALAPLSDAFDHAAKLGIDTEWKSLIERQFRGAWDSATFIATTYEASLATLDGQFQAYTDTIHALGLAITDTEIATAKLTQVQKLQQQFTDDLTSRLNSARGLDYLNQVPTISGALQTDLRNIAALYGTSAEGAARVADATELYNRSLWGFVSQLDRSQLDTVLAKYGDSITSLSDTVKFAYQVLDAQQGAARAGAERSAYLGLRDTLFPGQTRGAAQALLDAGLNPADFPEMTATLNSGFFGKAAAGTATADDMVNAYDRVTKAFDNGRMSADQYSTIIGGISTAWQHAVQKLQTAQGTLTSVSAYLTKMDTDNLSVLSPRLQLQAANDNFTTLLGQYRGGDTSVVSSLLSAADTYRQLGQGYYASGSGYVGIDTQIRTALTGVKSDAQQQVDLLQQAVTLTDSGNDTLTRINTTIGQKATEQVNWLSKLYTLQQGLNDKLVNGFGKDLRDYGANPTLNHMLAMALPGFTGSFGSGALGAYVANNLPNPQANFGQNADLNKLLAVLGNYSGDFGVAGASWKDAFRSMPDSDWRKTAARELLLEKGYTAAQIGFETGGMIPYANDNGGVVGNGLWGRDSVTARYAGGGVIALAGGEGILTAAATAALGGKSAIDAINAGAGALSLAPPAVYAASQPWANDRFVAPNVTEFRRSTPAGGGDTAALLAELRAVRRELAETKAQHAALLRQLLSSNAQGHIATREAVEEGNGHTADMAQEARLRRAAPKRAA